MADEQRSAPARREEMAAFAAELKANPAKAQKFFQEAGILNERGELTPAYGGAAAPVLAELDGWQARVWADRAPCAGGVSMYTIENRAGVDVLVMGRGAQPATEAESAFYAEVVRLRAEVEALKATPPDQREDLRCVIADVTRQCREARAEAEALRSDNSRQRIELENMGDTVTSLRSEVALYRGESEKLRDLLNYVPLPPVAITYERGWKLINMFQAAAIDAARAAQGERG